MVDNPATMQNVSRTNIITTYHQQAIEKDKAIGKLRQFPKVNIEGNIGAGKSTVLAALDLHYSCDCVLDPVAQWQHGHDVNILEKWIFRPITVELFFPIVPSKALQVLEVRAHR